MKAAKKERRRRTSVSASELALMGVCERLVVFEHRHGKRTTTDQCAAIRRGLRAHEQFYRDGRAAPTTRGRCFIATTVFGDGPETEALRAFRSRLAASRDGSVADRFVLPTCTAHLSRAGAAGLGALNGPNGAAPRR